MSERSACVSADCCGVQVDVPAAYQLYSWYMDHMPPDPNETLAVLILTVMLYTPPVVYTNVYIHHRLSFAAHASGGPENSWKYVGTG